MKRKRRTGSSRKRKYPEKHPSQYTAHVADIANRLRPRAIEWIKEYRCSGRRRARAEWMEMIKIEFVISTLANANVEDSPWQVHLGEAVAKTIRETCPNFETDSADKAIHDQIQQQKVKLEKKNPRVNFLTAKAYMWLQSLPPDAQKSSWYPQHAIQVAHQIFLGNVGKLPTFVRYLKHGARCQKPMIQQAIEAYEASFQLPSNKCNKNNDMEEERCDGLAEQAMTKFHNSSQTITQKIFGS